MATTFVESIYNDLEKKILTGEFAPDKKISSINQISKSFQASPGAVRYALKKLEKRGLLYSIRGKGTFVGTVLSSARKEKVTDIAFLVIEDEHHSKLRTREILSGAQKEAHFRGYQVLYTEVEAHDLDGLGQRVAGFADRHLLGMVHIGIVNQEISKSLKRLTCPLVLTSDVTDSRTLSHDFDIVTNDNYGDVIQAIDRLMEVGHRRIGFITTYDQTAWGLLIREGVLAGLAGGGLTLDTKDDFSLPGADRYKNYHAGYDLSGDITQKPHDRPSAFFIPDNSVAAGFIDGLVDRGIQVPAQISICGQVVLNSSDIPMRSSHQLTGITFPWNKIGRNAVRRLIELGEPGNRTGRHLIGGFWFEGTTLASPQP